MPAAEEEIIVCYSCQAPMNIATVAPYSRVVCPGCGTENRVKKQFGPYTLTRRHAIGGMSTVFIAKDEALDREVALKILSEEYSKDEKRISAFEEEARLTASFSHPNVVRVLTTGQAFGRLYIAMEFVPGGHFEQQIRDKGKVPEKEVLPFAIQVAEGLKGAQAAGLIHRDIKPGNILLDSEGNAKIVDFGLALVTKKGKAKATEIWATPYYVPPEAIEGGVEDFRADIYAFGATLYHALAGKPPCDEESMATDLLRQAKKNVVPLKQAAPHLLEETCAVVDKAMAYNPDERFSSYDEMIEELKAALLVANDEAVSGVGRSTTAERRAELRARKQRKTILTAGAIGLGGLAVALIAVAASKKTPPQEVIPKTVAIDPIEETPDENPAEITAKYRAARAAMKSGDYAGAGSAFSALLRDDAVQEPTRSRAALEAVIAALMEGQMGLARKKGEAAASHIHSVLADLDSDFANGVLLVLSELPEFGFLDLETLRASGDGKVYFLSVFLAGLNNWESGGLDQAVPFFEFVANESESPHDEVFSWYQEVAATYLADYELLTSGELDLEPDTTEQCLEVIEELNRKFTLVKTKGRAQFNVKARLLELARLRKNLQDKKSGAVEETAEPGMDVTAEIEQFIEGYRFQELAEFLSDVKDLPDGTESEALQVVAETAFAFLTNMETDLEQTPVSIPLTDRAGRAFISFAKKKDGELVGKLASEEVEEFVWTDFSSSELIELHRALIKSSLTEAEQLRRHESAIAFEWLTGDKERALQAAKRLALQSEEFRVRWEKIASGLPK